MKLKLPDMAHMKTHGHCSGAGAGVEAVDPKRRENAGWQAFAIVHPLFAQHAHIIFLHMQDSKNVLTYIFQPFH